MKDNNGKAGRESPGILQRYRALPRDLRSRHTRRRAAAQRLLALTICVPLMLCCGAYMLSWKLNQARIERDNAAYRALYAPETIAPTIAPSANSTEASATDPVTSAPSAVPSATASAAPSPTVTTAPTSAPTPEPTPTTTPTLEPTPTTAPTPTAMPGPSFAVAVDATRAPRATADADTLVFSLETPPPVQQSFSDLLALNPETVGYLTVGETISLPVVQRKNDNDYYLNHSFEGEESIAGTLFLDGSNLISPEDDNLIVYGHNMRNGTMFHALSQFEDVEFVKKHAVVHFDTIYENRLYVPFAAFTATMDEGSERYLDIRQFVFDEDAFELFTLKMEKLSAFEAPVDVRYGDRLLLLVTCEYLYDNGRFVVALRELRPDETEAQIRDLMQSAEDR